MEPIWTLLVESEEGVLLDELQENWNKRGFRLITEEQATSFSKEINGFLVQKASSMSQLVSRTTKYLTINTQSPFLILLVGDEISHGLADQLHAAFESHPIEVVRLFLFPDGLPRPDRHDAGGLDQFHVFRRSPCRRHDRPSIPDL